MEDSEIYKKDLIGLKTLNQANKIYKYECELGHLHFLESEIYKYIIPHLVYTEDFNKINN